MKKFRLLIAPLLLVPFLASCGSTEYKVSIPDINGLSISETKATKGKDYTGTIIVDTTKITDKLLPNKLDKVTSGNKELQLDNMDYTYTLKEDKLSADFKIPAANIVGDVTIQLSLVNKKWYECGDWWNYCSSGVIGEQATAADIGREVELTVNEQVHKVRLIGVDHDELNDDSGNKAHCTFEFSNLLSDSNGYSLATFWNATQGSSSTNYDYPNSDLRKALDGQGSGTLRWYQKSSPTKSTTYTGSVLSMLPTDLQNVIKEVKKPIAIKPSSSNNSSHEVTSYNAKVFPLSRTEITTASSQCVEGSTYAYYTGDGDTDANRIKHQVKWHDGAATSSTIITDPDITWDARSYAGYNSSTDNYGGQLWLRSPSDGTPEQAWYVHYTGHIYSYAIYTHAHAVAPAFCI